MIATALRLEIERYAARMRVTSPLFVRAEAGTLGVDHLLRYLESVRYLVCFTPAQLSRCVELSMARGHFALAAHLSEKAGEEVGHERWAERDMAMIGAERAAGVTPLASIRECVAFVNAIIEEDPVLYLAYALFAEYFAVLLGPEWLQLLESRCGVPRSSMSFLGNHVEADRAHAEDAFERIDALVGDPRMLPRMRSVVLGAIAIFDNFVAEIIREGDAVCHDIAPAA